MHHPGWIHRGLIETSHTRRSACVVVLPPWRVLCGGLCARFSRSFALGVGSHVPPIGWDMGALPPGRRPSSHGPGPCALKATDPGSPPPRGGLAPPWISEHGPRGEGRGTHDPGAVGCERFQKVPWQDGAKIISGRKQTQPRPGEQGEGLCVPAHLSTVALFKETRSLCRSGSSNTGRCAHLFTVVCAAAGWFSRKNVKKSQHRTLRACVYGLIWRPPTEVRRVGWGKERALRAKRHGEKMRLDA